MPDFKTIADFRRDNGAAIRSVCAHFIELCRGMKLFTEAEVAIDGSKFKAVNNRDRNFTEQKIKSRRRTWRRRSSSTWMTWIERIVSRPSVPEARASNLKEKIVNDPLGDEEATQD